jgi:hypothetical protein
MNSFIQHNRCLAMLLLGAFATIHFASTPAQGLELNLVAQTSPTPEVINNKRYVIISKGEQVSFRATTHPSVYFLSWSFENGSPPTGSANGPHLVTYGEDAEGKENIVRFTTKRRDENDTLCVTSNKRTCAVIVGAIKRAVAPAPGGGETFNLIRDANKKVLPGEKIILKCEIPTLTVQEYEWILSGTTFKDYTANQKTGTLTQLAAGDKNQQTVRFYWADTGDNREVICRVKINNKWFEIKNKLDVKKPVATFTTTLGTSALNATSDRIGLFADADSSAGITYVGNVTVPSGFSEGKWNWVQLVTPQRNFEEPSGQKKKWSQNVSQVLDTDYPYEPAPYTQHPGNAGAYNTNSSHTDSDSPSSPLAGYVKASTTNESFVMYLMFLPSGEQTRYVPLKKVNWSWSIAVTKAGATWSIDAGSANQSASAAAETDEHPTWSANVRSGSLVNE